MQSRQERYRPYLRQLVERKLGLDKDVTGFITFLRTWRQFESDKETPSLPLNKPFTGPQPWKSLANLDLSWGVSRGKPGGGDFGIDMPVPCGTKGG